MVKVAITGASGLIGTRILELLDGKFTFISLSQESCDITNKTTVDDALSKIDFDMLLHLAAYTNVDLAEKEKNVAEKINVEGTKNIFETVMGKKKKFIYISTDFVFDGTNPPYTEDSTPNPISSYGKTKYEGEKIVRDQAMIVRFSYPYRASFRLKKDFVRSIKESLEQNRKLSMVSDSLITPTFIDDIVYGLKYLFENFSTQTFHLVGANSLSPYESGLLIAKTFGLDDSSIQKTTYTEYFKDKAARPQFSTITSTRNTFYRMKTFEQGLYEIKKQM